MGSFLLLLASALGTWTLVARGNQAYPRAQSSDNRPGRLPAMGFNPWNQLNCNISETIVLQTVQWMIDLGLKDVGYEYYNIDDCWSEFERSASGDLVPVQDAFPSGINNLTDTLHGMGFKIGIYSTDGWTTCQGRPGSFQNEYRDAKQFVEWGFDYLKYDNCGLPYDESSHLNAIGRYQQMADAITQVAQETGKPPLLYSMSEWGTNSPWLWGASMAQSWRTTFDVRSNWSSVISIVDQTSFVVLVTDFYGRNDMDMLEIGNGDFTLDEEKAHFTAWALMKSPLLIGTDLSTISNDSLNILKNQEIIAINQDPVFGKSVTPFRSWQLDATNPPQYWSGQSQNGTVIMLINTLDQSTDMFFQLTESPWIRAGRQYSVRDLWAHTDNGTAIWNFTASAVPSHGVVALLLKDAGDEPPIDRQHCAPPGGCVAKPS